jgi:hypothetical protein
MTSSISEGSSVASAVFADQRNSGCAVVYSRLQLGQTTQSAHKTKFPIAAVILVGLCCFVCAIIFGSACSANSDTELGITCIVPSASSEAYHTFLMFALGYLCCWVAKRRHTIGKQVDRFLCLTAEATYSLCSVVARKLAAFICAITRLRLRSFSFQRPAWICKGTVSVMMVAVMCTSCIVCLLVSAFTAVPELDPTDAGDGLVSESSANMRIFTVGWMLIMFFKLRQELVANVGSCCLFQPW